MERRKWTQAQKLQIVLEGVRNTVPLGELCSRHGISQALYYQWRDRLLKHGGKAFDYGEVDREKERLMAENARLKQIIGELTVELKKSDEVPW